jgi:hypothetical protein
VLDGMQDVLIRDPVPAGGAVDVHVANIEVVSVAREDGSEVVIHAMRMRAKYEPFLRGEGDSDA